MTAAEVGKSPACIPSQIRVGPISVMLCTVAVLSLDHMTPPGMLSIELTFNGGGTSASVTSDAIVLVKPADAIKSQGDGGVVAGQSVTMTGEEFMSTARTM